MATTYCDERQRGTVEDHRRMAESIFAGVVTMPTKLVSATITTLLVWQERARQRHHLAEMDDRLLKDIGFDRADHAREIRKPFWQG